MTTAPDRTKRLASSRSVWVVPAVLVLLVGAFVGALAYDDHYRVWPWGTAPDVMHICGKTYTPSTGVIESRESIAQHGFDLVEEGTVPGWFNAAGVWNQFDAANKTRIEQCTPVVWVQVANDSYQAFDDGF